MLRTTAIACAVLFATGTPVFAATTPTPLAPPAGVQTSSAPSTKTAPTMGSHTTMKATKHASMSRERVEALQTALNNNGAKLTTDGIWGRKTEDALRDFQKQHGLSVSGRLDRETTQKLSLSHAG